MKIVRKFICHGQEDRCLILFGHKLPICSRCTGFYSGILIGFLLNFLFFDIGARALFILSLIGLIPLGFDGSIQRFTEYESNNITRLSTGLFCGIFIGMDIFWIVFLS
ncbi:MAG: DUF2085 domain-containing protein [Thermoplasmatota archaeon]